MVEMRQYRQCSGVYINDTVFLTQYNEIDKDYSGGKVWQVRQCYREGMGKTTQLFIIVHH